MLAAMTQLDQIQYEWQMLHQLASEVVHFHSSRLWRTGHTQQMRAILFAECHRLWL